MRKLSWTLLLPFFLLFAQQGEVRHEYGHYDKQASSCQKAPVDVDHCLQCLAYAQIGCAAQANSAPAILLSGLSFRLDSDRSVAGADGEVISPRSRGPPAL